MIWIQPITLICVLIIKFGMSTLVRIHNYLHNKVLKVNLNMHELHNTKWLNCEK